MTNMFLVWCQSLRTTSQSKVSPELMAIFKERMQERQKAIGTSLQKEAVESARASVMPKLKKEAREELIAL